MRSIAKFLGKSLTSVQMKASRLGLVDDDEGEKNTPSTTTLDKLILLIELPSIEEELKTLVAALNRALKRPIWIKLMFCAHEASSRASNYIRTHS
jgi:hypothetical protein